NTAPIQLVHLATRLSEVSIAPGIEHVGVLTSNLTTNLSEPVNDRLIVTVNGEKIKIPLEIVELEGQDIRHLRVVGEVIQPGFTLLPYTGGKSEKIGPSISEKSTRRICFKPMYYNTDQFCRWFLLNRSPKATDFVSVLCNQVSSDRTKLQFFYSTITNSFSGLPMGTVLG
ncbi:hypothetical protein FGIG_12583, partial [Fasciola gigantica]